MRLFTHNFLQCHAKGCTSNNFPLTISNDCEIISRECEYNGDFIRANLCKLDIGAIRKTIEQISLNVDLPEIPEDESLVTEEMLMALHEILFKHAINSGSMTCPNCGHIYTIKDSIPNMLLGEDEI